MMSGSDLAFVAPCLWLLMKQVWAGTLSLARPQASGARWLLLLSFWGITALLLLPAASALKRKQKKGGATTGGKRATQHARQAEQRGITNKKEGRHLFISDFSYSQVFSLLSSVYIIQHNSSLN
jgi:hypothetical protein